jgi:hypothetical protein
VPLARKACWPPIGHVLVRFVRRTKTALSTLINGNCYKMLMPAPNINHSPWPFPGNPRCLQSDMMRDPLPRERLSLWWKVILGLSPSLRQTVKILCAVRWNSLVLRRCLPARCAPAGEAEAGPAGAVAAATQGIASRKLIRSMSEGAVPQGGIAPSSNGWISPLPQKTHKESCRAAASLARAASGAIPATYPRVATCGCSEM